MKKILITTSWDDGHLLDLKLTELLQKYSVAGTLYISPNSRESRPQERLSDSQIRELSKHFEIGAHTLTHPHLTALGDEEAQQEIVGSKKYLETLLQKPVESFCYPAGYYNSRHERMVKDAGFKLARTTKRFRTGLGDDLFTLPTTVHAYRHWSDAWQILKSVGVKKFIKCYFNWDDLAITIFNKVSREGGVFHLWGHSWEIEKNNDWLRLERVLKYISSCEKAEFVSNIQLLSVHAAQKKTALFVTPYFPPKGGGLERYAYEVGSQLQKDHNWRLVVMTSGERGGKDSTEFLENMTVYRLGYRLKFSNTPLSVSWFWKIRAIVQKENPDIINVHTPVPGIGDIATLVAKKPLVVTYHTGSMRKGKLLPDIVVWLYEHTAMHWLLRRASHIICSSDFVRLEFLRRWKYKATTITPGVDSVLFAPDSKKKSNRPRVLFVPGGLGKAEQHKGLWTLLGSMHRIRQELPDVELVVLGDGDMRSEYEAYTRKEGLEGIVIFMGRLSGRQLTEAYQQAHVLAHPSQNDSFATVIFEAMASGLPVVASSIGSIPSLVLDGETGFLIEPKNTEMLAQKLLGLLHNKKEAAQFGKIGRAKVEQDFGWQSRVYTTHSIFEEVLRQSINPLIVHIAAYYPPHIGGLERVAKMAAETLAERGRDVLVLTSDIDSKRSVERSKHLTVKRLFSFEFAHTPLSPTLVWHLLRLPKKSIIHLHLSQAYWPELMLLAAKARGIPYLIHFHLDVDPSGVFGPAFVIYKKILWGPLLRGAQRIIVCSSEQAAIVEKKFAVPKEHVAVVPNAIDEIFFLNPPRIAPKIKKELRLLYVGRLVRQKRVERLIEVISLLSFPCRLSVVGDGEERATLELLAKKLKLKNIFFEGAKNVESIASYYQTHEVLLMSSDKEGGTPLVALEGMAAGLVVVGSNVEGMRELLEHAGILIDEPYAQNFAKAIEALWNDPEQLEKLSQLSREKAKEYRQPRFANRLDAIYTHDPHY